MQVFAHTGQKPEDRTGSWDEEDMNGYQLVNEVGTGGTLSSLFTILSLFTEDVKISWQDSERAEELQIVGPMQQMHDRVRTDSDVSRFDLRARSPSQPRGRGRSPSESTVRGVDISPPGMTDSPAPMSAPSTPHIRRTPSLSASSGLPHYSTVARATEDATLAVIPAEAFRRLTKKFPKATAHIVQGMWSAHIVYRS